MAEFSPMMQQYLSIKAEHPDEILFFRLGDFYEMFFEDAVLVSKELDLTLTGRGCGQEERAPMCGVPYHSCEGYLARLIQKGYKVAICEQVEDPATTKGLVKRDIVRIVTPGTVIEQQLLEEGKNNFLAAVWPEGEKCGLCVADITTGTLRVTELPFTSVALNDELAGYGPSELLLPEEEADGALAEFLRTRLNLAISSLPEMDPMVAREAVLRRFAEDHRALLEVPLGSTALAGLVGYLREMQKTENSRFDRVQVYETDACLRMGATERAQLELVVNSRTGSKVGSLFGVLDKTRTGMGRRYLRSQLERPLTDLSKIHLRQDAVEELYSESLKRLELAAALEGIYDLERLLTRVLYNSISPRELKSLELTASKLPDLKGVLSELQAPYWKQINASFDTLADLCQLLKSALSDNPPIAIKDGDVFREGYHSELDELRDVLKNGRAYLARIEAEEKEKTGIRNLKVAYNRVFGYYIEVSKSNLDLVPEHYIRKQTLTTGERFITQELKELENRILTAGEQVQRLETELFARLKERVMAESSRIGAAAKAVQRADFLYALATTAADHHYCRPVVNEGTSIEILEGRHPVVELNRDLLFVANDTHMNCESDQVLIITGPNMAGKSTYMRQVALIVILAQLGSFVPAKSAEIGLVDQIFTRIGASDDLNSGQSTFMVEMHEMANILKNASPRSLILLDEVGRGTSTFDGMSIAKAAAVYLATEESVKARTLFATHYHELCALEGAYPGIVNYNSAAKKRGDKVIFLRRIVRGGSDESFGIEVAKLAGVPEKVTRMADEILQGMEHQKMPADRAVVSVKKEAQITSAEQTVLSRLKQTDPATLTPLEAMNLLFEMQKTLSEEV